MKFEKLNKILGRKVRTLRDDNETNEWYSKRLNS
jgi:hypothetical protein